MDEQDGKERYTVPERENPDVFGDGFIEETARKHGVPEDNPGKVKDVLKAASQVSLENLPKGEFPKGLPGKFIEAAVRVETVAQDLPLNPKQREFAKGLEENFKGAAGFFSAIGEKAKELFPEKGKIVKNTARTLLVAQMALSACNPVNSPKTPETLSAQPPAQTEIYTPTPAEPTPTFTPTPTETATPTPEILTIDDFKVVDGKIQENKNGTWQEVSVPTEMGEISYVEEHEGKMYGIDTVDRAVTVRSESGEWVKFERPIYGADFNNMKSESGGTVITFFDFNYSEKDLKDLLPSEIVRMLDSEGKPLPWGYQKGSYNWGSVLGLSETDPLPSPEFEINANYSGYFLGIVEGDAKAVITSVVNGKVTTLNIPAEFFIFEIPYRYERQIIAVSAPNDPKNTYYINFCNAFGNTLETHMKSGPQLIEYLKENIDVLKGKQIVIKFVMRDDLSGDDSSNFWKNSVQDEAYDLHINFLIEKEIWIPEGIVK